MGNPSATVIRNTGALCACLFLLFRPYLLAAGRRWCDCLPGQYPAVLHIVGTTPSGSMANSTRRLWQSTQNRWMCQLQILEPQSSSLIASLWIGATVSSRLSAAQLNACRLALEYNRRSWAAPCGSVCWGRVRARARAWCL